MPLTEVKMVGVVTQAKTVDNVTLICAIMVKIVVLTQTTTVGIDINTGQDG